MNQYGFYVHLVLPLLQPNLNDHSIHAVAVQLAHTDYRVGVDD